VLGCCVPTQTKLSTTSWQFYYTRKSKLQSKVTSHSFTCFTLIHGPSMIFCKNKNLGFNHLVSFICHTSSYNQYSGHEATIIFYSCAMCMCMHASLFVTYLYLLACIKLAATLT
jgi:hypothetical protein